MNSIKVILADDHSILRRSLCGLLGRDNAIEVTGEAGDGEELVALCRSNPPDVAVVDIRMPGMDGIEAARIIKDELPRVKVLMLTTFDDDEYLRELFQMGVDGYLLKSSGDVSIAAAVKSVYAGINTLDKNIISKLGAMLDENEARENVLTETELRVARLMAQGTYNKDIAVQLCLSYGRVRNIVSDIYHKLGVTSRAHIADKLD